MSIKKRFKKEKAMRKRTIAISIVIMILMPYMVFILNDEGIFKGWEYDFAQAYAILVDLLLVLNIIRIYNESNLKFQILGRKIKIKDSFFKFSVSIPFEKILYIDILEKKNLDFDIFIVMKKGKKHKRFMFFNISYVKTHLVYKPVYEHLNSKNETVDYLCMLIKRGGTRKFYLLYLIFKNAYNAESSQRTIEYVKKIMEEYNLS